MTTDDGLEPPRRRKSTKLNPYVEPSLMKDVEDINKMEETSLEPKEVVNHPAHYGGKDNPYETVKVLKAWGLDKCAYLWTVGKYLSRAGKKDALLQELKKARWYLDYKIEILEQEKRDEDSKHT